METTVKKIIQAIALAGVTVERTKIELRTLGCPHQPQPLARGKMGIYIFKRGDAYLKIGKAGPKSNARFQAQHYSPRSTKSNLAKSLLADSAMKSEHLSARNVGGWMKKNLSRIDILLDDDLGIQVLSFIEAFLHCRFSPKYEGHMTQGKKT